MRRSFAVASRRRPPAPSSQQLAHLVDRSLLRRTPDGRYRRHPLLLQYATEQLDRRPAEAAHYAQRHVAYFGGWLQTLTPAIYGDGQAAALEAELNALVAAEPILFDKGNTTISDASQSTLVKVAGLAERYAGVAIEVQGHTDSEGDAGRNLTLSEDRAGAVLDALVALGVPVADLTAAGYGEADLILGADGEEDPAASRRVVFAVVVVP